MTGRRVYISGMGVISALGCGVPQTQTAIEQELCGLHPVTRFETTPEPALPVGEITTDIGLDPVPRTHKLARIAADQAMAGCSRKPDAVVLGVTTGGISTTESLLKQKCDDPLAYRYHGIGSVAEDIAGRYGCTGPVLTLSTACSSGAVAIKLALELLRSGRYEQVLAGGADALCKLTYHGFKSLQLIDPAGARPLDTQRRGMSVAEGAAVLLLTAHRTEACVAEILGAAISCDAYHPARPQPDGKGALQAMQAALQDARIEPEDVDYINLHGTGTLDNDLSEARAVNALFRGRNMPRLSSVKGAFGHTLAAAGAIEAVVSSISISENLVPANSGCHEPDPELACKPVSSVERTPVNCVLSNSFGFGGNNASIVLGSPDRYDSAAAATQTRPMKILGTACITGAGNSSQTMERIADGMHCRGCLPVERISENLSPGFIRRLKRLSRITLALAHDAFKDSGQTQPPNAVFMGTGWGALTETHDFLSRLFESDERFASPTDFVGSVHNAAAGQVALQFHATGANVTASGGDYSFEQALMSAQMLSHGSAESAFLIGADETHDRYAPLFDQSIAAGQALSDGGAAFCLKNEDRTSGRYIDLQFYAHAENNPDIVAALIGALGGARRLKMDFAGILAGMPAASRKLGEEQLRTLTTMSGPDLPVIKYRDLCGEFASASAVAAMVAAEFIRHGEIPPALVSGKHVVLGDKALLVLGLGRFLTAMKVFRR